MSEGKVNNDDENGHSERSPYEMGVDKFKSLNIPFNTQVYDLASHTSVSVGDRTTPQGFCNVMWYDSGFYVTIDEKTAIEQGTSNAIWQMGFMVSKTLQSEYDAPCRNKENGLHQHICVFWIYILAKFSNPRL